MTPYNAGGWSEQDRDVCQKVMGDVKYILRRLVCALMLEEQ